MAEHSSIEWTDATWNPITGCSIKSPGCRICYAMKLAATRLKHHPSRKGLTREVNGHHVWTGEVRFNEGWLTDPIRWKRPRMVFVCAHGDLFHESVPDVWIDRVFAVMALAPQHTFQVLTKRSDRMRDYLTGAAGRRRPFERIGAAMVDMLADSALARLAVPVTAENSGWPLPNVWLGVSAERQQEADERIPDLLATPAAVRFVSLEPLLGPIDLTAIERRHAGGFMRPLDGRFNTLDWIIVGGESGAGASPMHPAWVRSLRDQCAAAGKAERFFFKQWGAWVPVNGDWEGEPNKIGSVFHSNLRADDIWMQRDGLIGNGKGNPHHPPRSWCPADMATLRNVGKKAAGRLLDGVEHNGMPR